MKPKYIICLILLCAIMLTGYIIAYNVSYRINYIPESKKQSEDSSKDSISNNESQTQNSDSQANVKADTGIDITVKKNMEYVLEKYYLDDYSLVEEKRKIPPQAGFFEISPRELKIALVISRRLVYNDKECIDKQRS